jgi:hypothetical protein
LRYLPFPYPSVSTVQAWILQGETMVAQQVLPACHHGEALKLQRYTAKNLIELQRFRDRIGWRMAFVEDSLLSGFLLTRTMKSQKMKLKEDAIKEMKDQAEAESQSVDREQLARQLIGPRGGLPTLKDDLIRLAHLLRVTVESNDTVAKLQQKVRPTVQLLMDKKTSSSTATAPSSAVVPSPKTPPARPARAETWSTPSSWCNMSGAEAAQMEEKMKALLQEQEVRFQGMLNQVMAHVMSVGQVPNGGLSADQIDEAM